MADLEGQHRSLGVGEVDLHPVLNVDGAHLPAIDVHPVEAAVIDANPAPMVEPQNQMFTRDQRVGNPYVGLDVAPDDDVVAGRERARRSVVPHSQRGRCWSAHRDQHPGVATTDWLWYSFTRMPARVVGACGFRHTADFGCRADVGLFAGAMASFVAATPSTAPITLRHASRGRRYRAIRGRRQNRPALQGGWSRVGDSGDMRHSGGYGHERDAVSFGCAQQFLISRVWITAAKADQYAFGHIKVAAGR